jgi:hypothetical protein
MAQDYATFSFYDYDTEPTSFRINVEETTAANIDAQVALLATLRTATNNIILGGVSQSQLTDILWDTLVPTTNPFGQREIKWTVIVQDLSGNRFKGNEIPMANLDLLENSSKYIVKNGAVAVSDPGGFVAAWVAAYEAVALSNSGEVLEVVDMYQSGRNL